MRQRGFTLIEIMVVVAIIGLLATIITTNVLMHQDTAMEQKARADVTQIYDAVVMYKMHHRRMPETLEELVQPDAKGRVWLSGRTVVPKDPWQNEYVLRLGDDSTFSIHSWGPDQTEDTEDDLSSATAKDS